MHPELEDILLNLDTDVAAPGSVVLKNAEALLNYMDDIYVERTGRFEYTPAESLYIRWNVEGLEFHIECLKNGLVFYTFRQGDTCKAFGRESISDFIPQLQRHLLAGMC